MRTPTVSIGASRPSRASVQHACPDRADRHAPATEPTDPCVPIKPTDWTESIRASRPTDRFVRLDWTEPNWSVHPDRPTEPNQTDSCVLTDRPDVPNCFKKSFRKQEKNRRSIEPNGLKSRNQASGQRANKAEGLELPIEPTQPLPIRKLTEQLVKIIAI